MNTYHAYHHPTLLRIITITAFLALMPFSGALSAHYPEIKKPVNDYAGVISHHHEKRISDLIVAHREKTGVQIAVLTVPSTGTMRIEDYSLDIAQKWGGGSRDRDDGLLFIIAVNDRRMRLEVGDGLRGYIPDNKAQQILDQIKSDFRKGAYGMGILKVTQSIIGETAVLRAGEPIPLFRRIMGAFYHTISFYFVYFLLGIMLGGNFTWYRENYKGKKKIIVTLAGVVLIWIALTLLIFLYFRRVWFWEPIVYLGGVIGGSGVVASYKTDTLMRRTANVIMIVTTVINLASAVYVLDLLGPHTVTRSDAEIGLAVFFPMICLFQLFFWPIMLSPTGAHSSYSSGSSSSSYSSFSSSSSGSSSWSGGGGSFSGGGATSSW